MNKDKFWAEMDELFKKGKGDTKICKVTYDPKEMERWFNREVRIVEKKPKIDFFNL